MQKLTSFLLSFIFCWLSCNHAFANIRHLDTSNGLSNNEVTSFYQDIKGFVWVGTFDGLNRYDGYKFTTFRNSISDKNSLINNKVLCITQDQQYNLWVGTEGGVNRYDILNAKFYQINFMDPDNRKIQHIKGRVNMIKESASGSMAIASETEGFFMYNLKDSLARSIPLWLNNKAIYHYNAISLTVDLDKNIWVLVNGFGLCILDKQNNRLVLKENSLKSGNFILADGFKNIWIGTDKSLYKYTADGQLSLVTSDLKVIHLCIDHKNNLWIATDGQGIMILNTKTGNLENYEPKTQNRFLANPVIYTVFEDRENRKWIGNLKSGIVLIDENKLSFQTYSHVLNNQTNLNADFILSICKDSKGNLWVGTDGNGIKKWNSEMTSFISFKKQIGNSNSLSSNNITDIIEDKNGNIWVNTWEGGINKYNNTQNTFKTYKLYNTITKSIDRFGWRIFEDKTGKIWASSYNGGLYYYNPSADAFELFDNSLKSILCFAEDGYGNLWVGTPTSIVKIDKLHKKNISYLIGYAVRSIHEDVKHQIWVATEGTGLLKFNPQTRTIQKFTVENGLPNNSVLNILEDKNYCLWVSTYSGISRFNIATKKFNSYTKADGLQSNQFNYNAALEASNHEFIFGGINGFNTFDPLKADDEPNGTLFKVNLDGIRVNNADINKNPNYITQRKLNRITALAIPYSQANISFDFVMPEFSSADRIEYAFFLKGLEKEWNYTRNLRSANYGKLPIGDYKLYVKTTDRSGNWLSPTRLLDIRILAPWYLTWWAYTLYLGTAIGILILFIRYKATKRDAEYKILEAVREKEQQKELNDKRLAFFTNISHEFRTPLTLILNPLKELMQEENPTKVSAELDVAYRNTKRLMTLVDQLLLFRKAENEVDEPSFSTVDFTAFCHEVYSYFTQQAKYKHIEYSFLCKEEKFDLEIDREKTEIALFNLLGNAIKFTPNGGSISLEITKKEQQVLIEIRDSGIGVDKEVADKLFENFYQVKTDPKRKSKGFGIGLYLAKKIIEQQKGTISYKSELGKGTSFYITLPLQRKFPKRMANKPSHSLNLTMLEELEDDLSQPLMQQAEKEMLPNVEISEKKALLIIDDNIEIRRYIKDIFSDNHIIYEADNGLTGLEMAQKLVPDLIISDLAMPELTGIELCQKIKNDSHISHIPIVLLTGNDTDEAKLIGIKNGAVDYIVKPFDKALLVAKIKSLLENNNRLQQYFLDTITLQNSNEKVPSEYKLFLEKCISTIESNIDNSDFNVHKLAFEMGMSHSNLYKRVKAISGLTVSAFIRSIRLRRAAVLMLKSNYNINQASFEVGIADPKYFRLHFSKLFGLKPSDYIRKYRTNFHQDHTVVR